MVAHVAPYVLHGVFKKHQIHGCVGFVVLPERVLENSRHGIQRSDLGHGNIDEEIRQARTHNMTFRRSLKMVLSSSSQQVYFYGAL